MSAAPAGDLAGRVAATGTLAAGAPVVVGCSGGRDSVCLLDLAVRIAGPDAVLAVHVHHGLRGADADRDARHVAGIARRLGVACRQLRLGTPPRAGSTGAWARAGRADALARAARSWGGPGGPAPVALAHTIDDQAETVVLRALSSPGLRALGGMADRDPGRGIVRPLLAAGVARRATAAWCTARGLDWREDPANPVGPRGRVRALLRAAAAIDERAIGTLVRTAERAREDEAALTAAGASLVRAGDPPTLDAAALRAAPPAIARRALRRLAEDALGRPAPRVERRLEDVLALAAGSRDPAALDLGDGVRVVVAAAELRVEPTPLR
ncbi:tRNA lysidine(34) synthetase [Patulibacter brassicae]|uniref:tRNA(Ile)-lysidine synthase n=1 Tax=Patulibacter brassicae TaxID=1705717 RepID=A0ABU4VMK7_9ACTN|nr:tRNA lysidine(34) synthetase [Patulibacter brassicae]MDX8153069.1 tRNA lysidine(34) synthetase [Patulibacter brassicae]